MKQTRRLLAVLLTLALLIPLALAEPADVNTATPEPTAEPTPEPTVEQTPETTEEAPLDETVAPTPDVTEESPEETEQPPIEETSEPTPDVTEETPEVSSDPTSEATEQPTPEVTEEAAPEVTEEPEVTEAPTPEVSGEPTPEITEEATAEPTDALPELPSAPELILMPDWTSDPADGTVVIPYTEGDEYVGLEWQFDGEAVSFDVQTAPVSDAGEVGQVTDLGAVEEKRFDLPVADHLDGDYMLYITALLPDDAQVKGEQRFRLELASEESVAPTIPLLNAQELAEYLGMTVDELAADLGVSVEELLLMEPEALQELYMQVHADEYDVETIAEEEFEVVDGVLVKYNGVPDESNNWTADVPSDVTSIGPSVFNDNQALKYVNLPSGVTNIGDSAFEGCTSLVLNAFPRALQTIGANAFANCTSLTSLNIPVRVTSIGAHAFLNCSSVTQFSLYDSITFIGEGAFDGINQAPVIYRGSGSNIVDQYFGNDNISDSHYFYGTNLNEDNRTPEGPDKDINGTIVRVHDVRVTVDITDGQITMIAEWDPSKLRTSICYEIHPVDNWDAALVGWHTPWTGDPTKITYRSARFEPGKEYCLIVYAFDPFYDLNWYGWDKSRFDEIHVYFTAPSDEPAESPTPEPVESPTPEPVESPTPEVTPSPTPEVTPSPTPEVTPSPTPDPFMNFTVEPSETWQTINDIKLNISADIDTSIDISAVSFLVKNDAGLPDSTLQPTVESGSTQSGAASQDAGTSPTVAPDPSATYTNKVTASYTVTKNGTYSVELLYADKGDNKPSSIKSIAVQIDNLVKLTATPDTTDLTAGAANLNVKADFTGGGPISDVKFTLTKLDGTDPVECAGTPDVNNAEISTGKLPVEQNGDYRVLVHYNKNGIGYQHSITKAIDNIVKLTLEPTDPNGSNPLGPYDMFVGNLNMKATIDYRTYNGTTVGTLNGTNDGDIKTFYADLIKPDGTTAKYSIPHTSTGVSDASLSIDKNGNYSVKLVSFEKNDGTTVQLTTSLMSDAVKVDHIVKFDVGNLSVPSNKQSDGPVSLPITADFTGAGEISEIKYYLLDQTSHTTVDSRSYNIDEPTNNFDTTNGSIATYDFPIEKNGDYDVVLWYVRRKNDQNGQPTVKTYSYTTGASIDYVLPQLSKPVSVHNIVMFNVGFLNDADGKSTGPTEGYVTLCVTADFTDGGTINNVYFTVNGNIVSSNNVTQDPNSPNVWTAEYKVYENSAYTVRLDYEKNGQQFYHERSVEVSDIPTIEVELDPSGNTIGKVRLNFSCDLQRAGDIDTAHFKFKRKDRWEKTWSSDFDKDSKLLTGYETVWSNRTYTVMLHLEKNGKTYENIQRTVDVSNITPGTYDPQTGNTWKYYFKYDLDLSDVNGPQQGNVEARETLDGLNMKVYCYRFDIQRNEEEDFGPSVARTQGYSITYEKIRDIGCTYHEESDDSITVSSSSTKLKLPASTQTGDAYIRLKDPNGDTVAELHIHIKPMDEVYKDLLRNTPVGGDLYSEDLKDLMKERLLDIGLTQKQVDDIVDTASSAPHLYGDLYAYSFFEYNFDSVLDKGVLGSYYSPNTNGLTIGGDTSPDEFKSTWFHESGHAVDGNAKGTAGGIDIYTYINKDELYEKLKNDTTKLLNNTNTQISSGVSLSGDGIDWYISAYPQDWDWVTDCNSNTPPTNSAWINTYPDPNWVYIWPDLYNVHDNLAGTQGPIAIIPSINNANSYMASDVNGGMTNNKLQGHFGHSIGYWYEDTKKTPSDYGDDTPSYMQCLEAWAEYFSAQILQDTAAINSNTEFFPEACQLMDQYANDMLAEYQKRYTP